MSTSKLLFLSIAFLVAFSISGCAQSPPSSSTQSQTKSKMATTASDNELRGPSSASIENSDDRFVDAQGCWQASQYDTEGVLRNQAQMANACRLFVDMPNVHISCPNKKQPQFTQTRILILEPESNPSKAQVFNKRLPHDPKLELSFSFHRMNGKDAEFMLYIAPKGNTAIQKFRLLAQPAEGNELEVCLSSTVN